MVECLDCYHVKQIQIEMTAIFGHTVHEFQASLRMVHFSCFLREREKQTIGSIIKKIFCVIPDKKEPFLKKVKGWHAPWLGFPAIIVGTVVLPGYHICNQCPYMVAAVVPSGWGLI